MCAYALAGGFISTFSFNKDEKTEIVVASFEQNPGMLYYWERKRKQEQEEPSPSTVKELDENLISKDTLEKITGLSGAALVAYLVLSEGARVLFPPRNFIPVPQKNI
ncbi:hypothetical protein NNC19_12720 [Clostridium sp. SHJSY1]|uniref:hypothetical protein n=1 Tax=Clostridium sp. SHJSY1 TaxID=2942483 RepID=UPI002875F861|nr:hypothetical protein [Clostridium sp. SHJSY1]MDS0526547.1 hypothetical protein [Clostridium sp. SHJSY1]